MNGDEAKYLPVNATRLLWNAKEKFNVLLRTKTDLTPCYVIEKTKELMDSFS